MSPTVMIILAICGGLGLGAILIYNALVSRDALADEGFSGMDVQLKRRADLIPTLVATVKGYMVHEKDTLERVTKLRAKSQQAANDKERLATEAELTQTVAKIMAVVENYPELRASANFLTLQEQLSDVEEQIQLARRYYNATVRDLNTLADMFPSNLIASHFKFQKRPYYELENAADKDPAAVDFSR
jgi:LemA protein